MCITTKITTIGQNLFSTDPVSKAVGTATGAGVGVYKTIETFDWQLFTIQTTISIVIASTIGFTITWCLGRIYKKIFNPSNKNE